MEFATELVKLATAALGLLAAFLSVPKAQGRARRRKKKDRRR